MSAFLLYVLLWDIFCKPCYGNVNILNPVPGTRADDSVPGKTKDGLEGADCFLSLFSENSVGRQFRNQWIVVGNGVQLFLNLHNIASDGTDRKRKTRIGFRDAGDFLCHIDIHRIAIIVADNGKCIVPLLSKFSTSHWESH